jgi:hypothetical protein
VCWGSQHSQRAHLINALDKLQECAPLRRTVLVRHILKDSLPAPYVNSGGRPLPSITQAHKPLRSLSASYSNVEKKVLRDRQKTHVMPVVQRIGAHIFRTELQLMEDEEPESDDESILQYPVNPARYHETDPEKVTWGPVAEKAGYFESVDLDGTVYKVRHWLGAGVGSMVFSVG